MKIDALRAPAIRACLLILWIPIIAIGPFVVFGLHRFMPPLIQNLLFFWPQAAFPVNTYHGAPPQVGARVWPGWWVPQSVACPQDADVPRCPSIPPSETLSLLRRSTSSTCAPLLSILTGLASVDAVLAAPL